MAGHVFVLHGDLLDVAADGVLIPCDATADVKAHWGRFAVDPDDRAQIASEVRAGAVSGRRSLGDQVYRYVDTGSTPQRADAVWLGRRVLAGLTRMVGDVGVEPSRHGRAAPLVAMPLFGTGDGGFDAVRGAALRAVLDASRVAVSSSQVDVAIVCFDRADFTALQRARDDEGWALEESVASWCDELAGEVRNDRLVLFLGAGVGLAAGLPTFAALVTALETDAGLTFDGDGPQDWPARATELAGQMSEQELKRRVADRLAVSRYSLAHGLLASIRVREAITTNFDDLYERACARPFAGQLEVLPWDRSKANRPWLLKAHGDATRQGRLVLTSASYDTFDADRAPVAGILRATFALSREVLFVGYSLQDPNVLAIMRSAHDYHRAHGVEHARLGTVIDIESCHVDVAANPARLGIRADPSEPLADAARRLEIVLDRISWGATRDEGAWLLDGRYRDLLDESELPAADALRTLPIPGGDGWGPVRRQLRASGSTGPD